MHLVVGQGYGVTLLDTPAVIDPIMSAIAIVAHLAVVMLVQAPL